ncbi:CLUMA_CG006683, isoform A [Clunio marinus]|uniref:CLUMA_CG006683, isoform A n=1 Tax=Clunio marinus TaxID=568069 RepID=A0A1J1HYE4_9DIPT|nr:CLUMA_CG006683, isoform A [Clunio marinus]
MSVLFLGFQFSFFLFFTLMIKTSVTGTSSSISSSNNDYLNILNNDIFVYFLRLKDHFEENSLLILFAQVKLENNHLVFKDLNMSRKSLHNELHSHRQMTHQQLR